MSNQYVKLKLLELNISSTVQILENVEIKADVQKGKDYFEGSVKFMKTLNEVLDMLIDTVGIAYVAQFIFKHDLDFLYHELKDEHIE